MADLHPPEPDTNGGAAAPAAASLPAAAPPPGDLAVEAAAAAAEPPAPPYSKRRRRPSVRLGDIGVQPTATASDAAAQLPRRPRKPSHSRPPRRAHPDDILDPASAAAAAQRRGPKPGPRRPRTAWVPAPSGYEDDEGHYYDEAYQSDSAAAAARARVSGSREASFDESDGVADWGLPNGRLPGTFYGGGGGIRAWLDGLGLARYAPVFEIHEVDEEVLPLLTLEDLKDMGIGAVGSRRKLFDAIQKLRSSGDGVS